MWHISRNEYAIAYLQQEGLFTHLELDFTFGYIKSFIKIRMNMDWWSSCFKVV